MFGRSPYQARGKAHEVFGQTRKGEHPAADRRSYRRAPTMKDLAERYMREHWEVHNKPETIEIQQRSFLQSIVGGFAAKVEEGQTGVYGQIGMKLAACADLGMILALIAVVRAFASIGAGTSQAHQDAMEELCAFARIFHLIASKS